MFATFTDRDGKYQLLSLAESAFDPLSRTCRFMLTEEAHHLFVGQMGVARIIERTAELVRQGKDPRHNGAIPFDVIQRAINFWYSVSLDLFGSEVSTNGATYFGSGLKGRPKEERFTDHRLLEGSARVEQCEDGRIVEREVAPRLAVNLAVRHAYQEDCRGVLERWNKLVADLGVEFRLPSPRFHRAVGSFAGIFLDPAGNPLGATEFERRRHEFLPTDADRAYVRSLMSTAVTQPGQFANWISPPARGIDSQPIDFEYVRFNEA
jgi:benzoyl-CoA 2,3-dioxygenase component B